MDGLNHNQLINELASTMTSLSSQQQYCPALLLQDSATGSSSAAVGDLASAGGNPIEISKAILEKDGIFGFWKGLRPTLIGIIPARSIYFFSYEQSKRFLGGAGLKEGEVSNALVSGFFAGKFESRRPLGSHIPSSRLTWSSFLKG